MGAFFRKLCSTRLLAIAWTLLTIVLLCLPGSSLEAGEALFTIPYFDKYVHVGLFGGITLFWGGYYAFRLQGMPNWRKVVTGMAILGTVLGTVLEFVQLYWIPDRSFDVTDIVADMIGSLLAALFLLY